MTDCTRRYTQSRSPPLAYRPARAAASPTSFHLPSPCADGYKRKAREPGKGSSHKMNDYYHSLYFISRNRNESNRPVPTLPHTSISAFTLPPTYILTHSGIHILTLMRAHTRRRKLTYTDTGPHQALLVYIHSHMHTYSRTHHLRRNLD